MNGNTARYLFRFALLLACVTCAAFAQLPSNASLKGAYNVRYLGEDTSSGAVMSFQGSITFDGAGKYTITGSGANSKTSDKTLKFLTSGTYGVLSNGMVSLDNPFDPSGNSAGPIFGGLAQNLVMGSSTEGGFVDQFVAIPAATSATNATITGAYNIVSLEFL